MAKQEINRDNLVLIRDMDRTPSVLFIETIYQGEETKDNPNAVIVPNVGDMVIDRSAGYPKFLEVVYIDETTLIPTLVEPSIPVDTNSGNKSFTLLGVGPGYQSETWRLFIDKSVVPHVILPDSRLHVYGKETTKYKIFLGTDTSMVTGKVISMNFNANGELISEDIPLEKVAFASTDKVDTNQAVKACRKGYTTHSLENGDVVTLVTYNDEGQATSYNTLLVHCTALDRSVEASTKYVTSISLASPFLDKTENNVLIFPMNLPRDALAIMGVVHYSDGTSKELAIDGVRFRLDGLDNYVPMKQAQLIKLTLTYNLPKGEMALNSKMNEVPFISVKYFGRTTPVDGSYSVSLFPIPNYVNDVYGWRLRWFLYTLDRDISYDVTDIVRAGANQLPFNPTLIGETQDITVSIDLNDVDPRLKHYTHVQSYKITLMDKPRTGLTSPFYIHYEKDQDPPYGQNIVCKSVTDPGLTPGQSKIDVSCGCKNVDEWLERVYYRTKPLYDVFSERRAPRPTHFTIILNDVQATYPLRAWNTTLVLPTTSIDGVGVVVQFQRIDGNTELQLGASPMMFMNLSENGTIDHGSAETTDPSTSPDQTGTTVIDIPTEVQRIQERNASEVVINKYRELLERIKRYGLLKYDIINRIYQRIRNQDMTPSSIANDVILLEMEVNKINIDTFNRDFSDTGLPVDSMENTR